MEKCLPEQRRMLLMWAYPQAGSQQARRSSLCASTVRCSTRGISLVSFRWVSGKLWCYLESIQILSLWILMNQGRGVHFSSTEIESSTTTYDSLCSSSTLKSRGHNSVTTPPSCCSGNVVVCRRQLMITTKNCPVILLFFANVFWVYADYPAVAISKT